MILASRPSGGSPSGQIDSFPRTADGINRRLYVAQSILSAPANNRPSIRKRVILDRGRTGKGATNGWASQARRPRGGGGGRGDGLSRSGWRRRRGGGGGGDGADDPGVDGSDQNPSGEGAAARIRAGPAGQGPAG